MDLLMNDTKRITVVIPLYNQVEHTIRCLNSLLSGSTRAHQLILINNNSTDQTVEEIEKFSKKFEEKKWDTKVIHNKENVGFGRAMNQGARFARHPYLALLNNDTWVMKNWDLAMLQALDHYDADMICPYYDEASFVANEMDEKADTFVQKNVGTKRKRWGSIMMFFKTESFQRVGMFDERFFVTFEDADLRKRMDDMKMTYYVVGDCFIWHYSKGTRDRMKERNEFEKEGMRLFVEKWGYDPSLRDNTYRAKFARRVKRWREKRGRL